MEIPGTDQVQVSGSGFRLRFNCSLPVFYTEGSWVQVLRIPLGALSHTVGDLRLAICGSARYTVSASKSGMY